MSQKFIPLFPPFLNAKSNGGAVFALQMLLHTLGYGEGVNINGLLIGKTVKAVKKLQEALGFSGSDKDGNFGPGTRAALNKQKGIDVNAIPYTSALGPTCWHSPGTKPQEWPLKKQEPPPCDWGIPPHSSIPGADEMYSDPKEHDDSGT